MKPNLSQNNAVTFAENKKIQNHRYRFASSLTLRAGCVEVLGVLINCKLPFHRRIDFLFSRALKLPRLIRKIAFCFTRLEILLITIFLLLCVASCCAVLSIYI
jgi:hypothetical protein